MYKFHLHKYSYTYKFCCTNTVEVTNRFKGLDLRDRVPDELWTEVHDIVQEAGDHPQEKEMQKGKWLSEEALQIAEKKLKAKEKGKNIPI